VVNHEPQTRTRSSLGTTRDGTPALINRHLVEASVRIITGFIEPHFSPGSARAEEHHAGCAGLDRDEQSRRQKHRRFPRGFGVTEGNPLWKNCATSPCAPADFLLNVTLNERDRLPVSFAGDCSPRTRLEWSLCEVGHAEVKSPFKSWSRTIRQTKMLSGCEHERAALMLSTP